MARVRDVEIHETPEDVRPVYRRFAEEYGPFLNQVKVFAHRPPAVKHIHGLLLELADDGVVPKRYLEIAVLVVSRLNECAYCVAHHTTRLADEGFGPETVSRILESDCPGLDPVELLVRDYAMEVTNAPRYISDAMFDRLKEHFSEDQIVELTMRIALCGFFNRFNDALRIDIEDGVIAEMLAKGGRQEDLPRATVPAPVVGK